MVEFVGDIELAVGAEGEVAWVVERGACCRTVVTGKTGGAIAGDCFDKIVFEVNAADAIIECIGDVESALCVKGQAAGGLRIQYGGSVKPVSAPDLMRLQDVDGLLVGGASLDPDEFARIVAYRLVG